MKLNLPNTITLIRIGMIPLIMFFLLLPIPGKYLISAIIFVLASATDGLDGHIARSRNLVTTLGKFLDPLADKFMVLAAMMCIMYRHHTDEVIFTVFCFLVMITVFRELAVTSIRLIAAKNANIVVAANMLGKIKTVSQIVCVMAALLEPVLSGIGFLSFLAYYPITLAAAAVTFVMTVWSGVVYLKTYWKYLDKNM